MEAADKSGEGQYSHVQSYLCRKSMLNLLEQSQHCEHQFLVSMENLTEKHTNKILDILVDWLEDGCQVASPEEIQLVSELTGINIADWIATKESMVRNDFDLAQCIDDVSRKDADLQSLSPWKTKMFGSDEDKAKVKAASELLEEAISKKETLENNDKELEKKTKDLASVILKKACANIDTIDDDHGLFGKIKQIAGQSIGAISKEIGVHTEEQGRIIADLENQIVLLKSLYQRSLT